MHTHKSTLVLRHCLSRAGVTLSEHRLCFLNRPGEDDGDPENDSNNPNNKSNDKDPIVSMKQSEFKKMVDDAVGEKIKSYPGLQESLRKKEKPTEDKKISDKKADDGNEDKSNSQTASTPAPSAGRRSFFRSPLDKTRDSGVISTGATAAAVGGSVYAGMNAAKFAGVPMLGKFAAGVGGALNGASTWVSSALTQVGAPSQLSVLANPWLIGMGAPLVGLWALGKYRMRTLKSYYQNHPSSPDAQATLEQIKQLENSTVLPRTFNTMKEGTKLVFGAMRWPIRAIPNALGSITGGGAAMVQNFSKKLGGLKGVLNWPFKNAGSLTKGGLAGGAAGIGTYAAMSAAAGVSAPLLAPFLIGAGTAIWAYKKFKTGKSGANANLAMAG